MRAVSPDALLEAITRELVAAASPVEYERAKRRASRLDTGRQLAVIDAFKAARARIFGTEIASCRCHACRRAEIRNVVRLAVAG